MVDPSETAKLIRTFLAAQDVFNMLTINPQRLQYLVQLDHQTSSTDGTEPNLGKLDPFLDIHGQVKNIPDVIVLNILRHMTVASLLDFRRVNSKAEAMVDSLTEWKKMMRHAAVADAVWMALLVGSAQDITVAQLFTKLCQNFCHGCGKHALFLDLVRLARRCLGVGDPYSQLLPACQVPNILAAYGLPQQQRLTYGTMAVPFLQHKSIEKELFIICFKCRYDVNINGKVTRLDPRRVRQEVNLTRYLDEIYTKATFRQHLDKMHGGLPEL